MSSTPVIASSSGTATESAIALGLAPGYATSEALRRRDVSVCAILRDVSKARRLEDIGCEVVVADLQQPDEIIPVLAGSDAVQVVVPLHPATPDPVVDMRRSTDALIEALRSANPGHVLAISDYGAHVADDIGMPSLFHDLERKLQTLGGPITVLRSAEHMHNIARSIPMAAEDGVYPVFQEDLTLKQPTIAAHDLGVIAADLLVSRPEEDWRVIHAEGPRRYDPHEVADALSIVLGRSVTATAVPKAQWRNALGSAGAPALSDLLWRTNMAKDQGGLVDIGPDGQLVCHGPTELVDVLRPFAAAKGDAAMR